MSNLYEYVDIPSDPDSDVNDNSEDDEPIALQHFHLQPHGSTPNYASDE